MSVLRITVKLLAPTLHADPLIPSVPKLAEGSPYPLVSSSVFEVVSDGRGLAQGIIGS